ncbi:MAG: hypothetical protein ACREQY_22835 [Candidatus Binatia bacterium]
MRIALALAGIGFVVAVLASVASAATSPCCAANRQGFRCAQAEDAADLVVHGGVGCLEMPEACIGGVGPVGCVCVDGVCVAGEGRTPVAPATPEQCAEAAAQGCCENGLIIRNCHN